MINQDKPTISAIQTELNIGGAFNLLVGGLYKLIIGTTSALSGITNIIRPEQGETWGTISTTWGTETGTWLSVSQLISNTTKPTSSMINIAKP